MDSKKSSQLPKNTYLSPTTPSTYIPPTTIRPNSINYNPLGYDHYKTPTVFIQPNAAPVDSYLPANHYPSTTERPIFVTPNVNYLPSSTPSSYVSVPSTTIQTPFDNNEILHQPIAVYSPSTTPAPSYIDYGTPLAAYSSSASPSPSTTPQPDYLSTIHSSSPRPDYGASIEQINNELSAPFSSNFIQSTTSRPFSSPSYPTHGGGFADGNNNVDVQPLFNRNNFRRPSNQYYNQISSSFDPSYYDGVSQTRNGFKYFLPRQYHEEDNSDPERRDGSFGYIDPFGIRRVIYYNTSPEKGFVHRKNNRYVGFDATPYDPRP